MTYWEQKAAARCPNAARLNRIRGEGRFALLSCKQGPSRFVYLFLDESDRNRMLWKWDAQGCCGSDCDGDHVLLTIAEDEDETTKTKTEEPAVHAAG